MNKVGEIKDKNILLLQGPVGPFFKKLDNQFREKGAKTFRIGFNAGDCFFSNRDNYTPYRDTPQKWQEFILEFLKINEIDKIFLFGDCRYYQNIAIKAALSLDREVYVFEEGYIRPHYITLEKYGVNNYSHLSRNPDFYKKQTEIAIKAPAHAEPNAILNWGVVIAYYFVAKLLHFRYPNYLHHRNYSAVEEFFYGTRSLIRKPLYNMKDKKYSEKIKGPLSKKYFLVPLQTHNDFQILQHSGYGSIEKFIIEVIESFAKKANKEHWLIFKHHPIDRGRKNYKNFIFEQALQVGLQERVLVIHDLHLPMCLQNAIGTVTINSTVGLSSLYHEIPTITLGNALYDIQGLTCKGMKLDNFWTKHKKPDMLLFKRYRNFIIDQTQLSGSFYGLMPDII